MSSVILDWLKKLSHALGFDTADSFPPGHQYARTRWAGAYFDIPSDTRPDDIERRLCDAIANTPLVFAHIENPTPRMQRVLIELIERRLSQNHEREAVQLAALLIRAYASPHIIEAMPGLRRTIDATEGYEAPARVRTLFAFLTDTHNDNVIEMRS
ncbi:hypothetical protein [Pseudoduganella violaceinigra]|uniref:hypothetical protein n=1 Tax=Pseudoduganella violaceinigra TaxID=246602 RepID=UPI0004876D2B|nr:hypothetical protein [Pseudoduganella violaceinigra]